MRLTGEFKGVPYQLAKDVWEEYQRTNNAKLLDAFISRLGEGGENAVLLYAENCDTRRTNAAFNYFLKIIYERQRLQNISALLKGITNREQCKVYALPPELDSPSAMEVFEKAEAAELMKKESHRYRWNKTLQLLAYLAEKMSHYLKLSNTMTENGKITTSWKPFEILFGLKERSLKNAKQNWMKSNTKFEPPGYEQIDKLF